MRRLVSLLVCLLAGLVSSGRAVGQPTVMVWPARPGVIVDQDASGRAVRAAGLRSVPLAELDKALRRHQEAAEQAERQALDTVQKVLDTVQAAYLEQRFDDMLIALAPLQGNALDVLTRPEHRAVLWQVELQFGLAYLARNRPGDGDLASDRFARALIIDPERRPPGDLYGPDVANAFGEVVARQSRLVAQPVRLAATPSDARIVIDGVTVVETGQPIRLVPGNHYVHASAPGYAPDGFTLVVAPGGDGTLKIPLARISSGEPIDRLGPAWALGALRPHTRSGQAAIRAVLAGGKVDAAIVIDRASGGDSATARVITASEVGPAHSGASVAEALRRALATLDKDGRLVTSTGQNGVLGVQGGRDTSAAAGGSKNVPVYKRWWFWLGIGVVAGGAFITAREARKEDARLHVIAR